MVNQSNRGGSCCVDHLKGHYIYPKYAWDDYKDPLNEINALRKEESMEQTTVVHRNVCAQSITTRK